MNSQNPTSRRQFLAATTAFGALLASSCMPDSAEAAERSYGPLQTDPEGLFDLPAGFSYRATLAISGPW
ncbi:MAG: twin-arginine translocation signal domain-containing protein [Pseudomonadota bacterium]